ncbi:hypothetical protein [Paracidovorax avenae]|uniref:hypothetical protein n=1 Tax=Paracidovorax avenae TaxID=80867 RepID=UPI0013140A0B|nr:hypothetical protein [Paracidovorax avenae]
MSSTDALEVEGLGTEEDALANLGDTIVLDLRYGATARVHADASAMDAEDGPMARRFVGGGMRPNAKSHRRLSSILDTLILSPALAESNISIEYGDLGPFPANYFFLHLKDVSRNHEDELHAVWGPIFSYGTWNGDLWLNAGGRASISIVIPSAGIREFMNRNKLEELEELVGSYVLAIGTISVSGRNKIFLAPSDVDHITVKRSIAKT